MINIDELTDDQRSDLVCDLVCINTPLEEIAEYMEIEQARLELEYAREIKFARLEARLSAARSLSNLGNTATIAKFIAENTLSLTDISARGNAEIIVEGIPDGAEI